jgi:hypothetical protein
VLASRALSHVPIGIIEKSRVNLSASNHRPRFTTNPNFDKQQLHLPPSILANANNTSHTRDTGHHLHPSHARFVHNRMKRA